MSKPSRKQREALLWYYAMYAKGWSITEVPPFNMRTIKSLKRRRWLQGSGKLCNITSAGIKALGCATTARVMARKSKVGRVFQEQRIRAGGV